MGFERPLPRNRARDGGWIIQGMNLLPHLCFPPRTYPTGVGPGTNWQCQSLDCLAVWDSHGAQMLQNEEDWPTGTPRRAIIGPEFWRIEGWPVTLQLQEYKILDGTIMKEVPTLKSGIKMLKTLLLEHNLYDFRGIAALNIKYQKLFAEAQDLNWKAIYD